MQNTRQLVALGIDPGLATTGYGVIEKKNGKFSYRDHGAILTPKKWSFEKRLEKIYNDICNIIKKYNPSVIGVEEIFFSANAKTAFLVGQARGVILLAAAMSKIPIIGLTPLQIKQSLVGYGRAEKIQVQKMIQRELSLKTLPRPDDAADALALALCCAHAYFSLKHYA